MAKLGYTWYPKDWGNSESVFELNLSERGLYRELIDLAMLNDNKTEIKLDVWCRKFAINIDDLKVILNRLAYLNLINIKDENLFIPSCESRLKLVRGGSNGGKVSKPNIKPIAKPIESLDEKNLKPDSNQIESKLKENINETNIVINKDFFDVLITSDMWIECNARNNHIMPDKVKTYLRRFYNNLIAQGDKKPNKNDFQSHFARWLPTELAKDKKAEVLTKKSPLL
jgi:hypothetical protein